MDSHGHHESTLSAHRAFVVHLSAAPRRGRRRFTGQVEHLSSGRTRHFSSLKGLVVFLAEILDAPAPEVPRAGDHDNQSRT